MFSYSEYTAQQQQWQKQQKHNSSISRPGPLVVRQMEEAGQGLVRPAVRCRGLGCGASVCVGKVASTALEEIPLILSQSEFNDRYV